MKGVGIGFSTRKRNPMSRLIRWFTRSRWSHAWVRYHHDLYKADLVVEAEVHGIVESEFRSWAPKNDDIVTLLPPEGFDLGRGMVELGMSLGTPYDYGSLFGRVWVYLWRWLGRKVRNPLANPRNDCCVENAIRCVQGAGGLSGVDPEEEDPESLHEKLLEAGWAVYDGD